MSSESARYMLADLEAQQERTEKELNDCKDLIREWLDHAYSLSTIDHIIDLVKNSQKVLGIKDD